MQKDDTLSAETWVTTATPVAGEESRITPARTCRGVNACCAIVWTVSSGGMANR